MAIIKIIGNKTISVSEDKAQRIFSRWNDNSFERTSVVDLGLKNFIQLGQIKGIDFQTSETSGDQDAQRQKWEAEKRDWDAYVAKCKAENPEQKARRTIRSFAKLLFLVRRNKGEIAGELEEKLMIRLIAYFEKNPAEWHATSQTYADLIPFGDGKMIVSKVEGIKTIGELMNTEAPKNHEGRASCDICGKSFKFSGVRPLFCPRCEKKVERGELELDI